MVWMVLMVWMKIVSIYFINVDKSKTKINNQLVTLTIVLIKISQFYNKI